MPGADGDLGLSYESCRKVNPALIYCSTTQMGQTGPYKGYVGVGFQTNECWASATTPAGR